MPDAERPGGGEARPRLLAFRGGTTRRPSVEPGDLARRLANLERQVEAALAGAAPAASRLDAALDRLLDRYAETRRWLAERVAAAGGVSGLALEAAYRWWWRVETHGLERVPGSGRVLLVANRAGRCSPTTRSCCRSRSPSTTRATAARTPSSTRSCCGCRSWAARSRSSICARPCRARCG